MKSIKYILVILLIGFSFSCDDDFEELNTNPNQPEEVPMATLLPNIIVEATDASVMQSYLIGNNVAQLTAKTLRKEVDIYQWASFANLTWTPFYNVLRDVRALELQAEAEDNPNYQGITMVMRTWIFSVLTDAYGDIPYTDALKADEGINFPEYDTQEAIYTGPEGLLATLDEALTLMGPGNGNVSADGDILFSGDISQWEKLANSLKFRLLLRVANINPSEAAAQMQAIVDSGIHLLGNEDNAVLEYLDSPPYQFPVKPLKSGDFDAVNISERLVETFKMINDPRLEKYARPANEPLASDEDPVYAGLKNGDETSSGGSRLGYEYYDYLGHRTVNEDADGIIMTYAELQFILAEAVEKGWVTTGLSSEDHFKAGIEASLKYYDVFNFPYTTPDGTTLASFDEYYDQPQVSLSAASDKLARIAEQKWIAIFFTGLEPWFEYKRTGLPALQPTPDNENNDQIPVRFIYPGQEQSLNQDNYQAAIARLGGDDININTWWDVE